MIDIGKIYSDKGLAISFKSLHVHAGIVSFPAILTEFSDKFDSEWNQEKFYGHMDPFMTFTGTTRSISFAWDVVAGSHKEAISNLHKASLLLKMIYPTYDADGVGASGISSTRISGAPIFQVKLANLISGPGGGGLTGVIAGFTYSPDLEQNFFANSNKSKGIVNLHPQVIKMNCEFTVLHDQPAGWNSEGDFTLGNNYPYGGGKKKSEVTPTPETEGTNRDPDDKIGNAYRTGEYK